ncbi:MAG: ABC transporter ATP-binding protein/permease [Lachnospiraceae bacterium]|nr:ABC transporter ATP-binding protein/permease [Lachnospiraceae bacterium]
MEQLKTVIRKTLFIMNRPQKILGLFVLILTFIGSGLELLGVSAIIPLVNVIQDADTVMKSDLVKSHSFLQSLSYRQMVLLITAGVILLYTVKNAYFIFLSWFRVKFSCKIQREISVKMLASYLSRGYQYFLNTNYGEFHRGVSGDTTLVYSVLVSSFSLISEGFTLLMIGAYLFYKDWMLALAVCIMALICVAVIFLVFKKKMYRYGLEARKHNIDMEHTLAQTFQGVKDLLLRRKQIHFVSEYERHRIGLQRIESKQTMAVESPAHLIEGFCIFGMMTAIAARILIFGSDRVFVAVLAAFAVGAFRILPSLGRISASMNTLTNALPSINAVYDQVKQADAYAKKHPEAVIVKEETGEKQGLISHGGIYANMDKQRTGEDRTEKFKDKIELKNISFRYSENLDHVLKNVDLTIRKGESVAFIGTSGAGKTTLVDVLLGLLVPEEGAVFMDGEKITEIPEKWADTIGYVPQNVSLFDASIKVNVAFGEREEDIDLDRVMEALERAELAEFVKTLPEGIETTAGDNGVRLSGGQRQRIAIARALYYRPEILILDEATSALDNDTESAIMSAIDTLQGEVTLVIVAHRLTTVRNCDVIYEVANGSIRVRDKAEVLGGLTSR